jgi:steroid delta-isomerase-like uncharacterized protein
MSEQDNLAVQRRIFDAWNAHDPEELFTNLAEDFVYESDSLPTTLLMGHAAMRSVLQTYVTAFPDFHLDVEQQITSGDFVVTRWRATGTHRGELNGIPPTGRPVVNHGCGITEFKNGQAIHRWEYWDNVNMLRQLGVMPALT